MFHVSPDETIQLAREERLVAAVARTQQRDFFDRAEVTWTSLAFTKAD